MKLFGLKIDFSRRNAQKEPEIPKAWLGGSDKNQIVSPEQALRVGAVYSCVRVISETVATLPCILYQRTGESTKQRAYEHPLYDRLHDAPNDMLDAVQFFEMITGHAVLRGNAFVHVDFAKSGTIFTPLHPDKVTVKTADQGRYKYYEYVHEGNRQTIKPQNMIHIMGLSSNGMRGYSVIELAMRAANLANNQEEYASKMFANSASPSGILQHPGQLGDVAAKRLKQDFEAKYAGTENAGTTMLLEEGLEWKQIGLTNEQAQFIESRNFSVTDIARWFRVPPHKIGQLDKATFSNIEHQALEFVTDTIRPWLVRIERAFMNRLFTTTERKQYTIEFLADAVLRGDIKTRHEVYAIGRQWGLYNADECRAKENMNPIPEEKGKIYLHPSNMIDVSKMDEQSKQEPQQQDPKEPESNQHEQEPTDPEEDQVEQQQRAIAQPVIESILRKGFRRRSLQNTPDKRVKEINHFTLDIEPILRGFKRPDKLDEIWETYINTEPTTETRAAAEKILEILIRS